ncbi:MAG: uracil-DNA glycosylase [Deltaproteobacteria bacterium]|nr:uracil-DNA glycosylase [Deltaproteobacteria bacterium]
MRALLKSYQEMGLDPPPVPIDALAVPDPVRARPVPPAPSPSPRTKETTPVRNRSGQLEELRDRIGECQQCKLHNTRTHLVFGEGSPEARLVFVGEGPGHDEDMAGRPFVGESGKLLTRIIENGMGLTRKDVYICNVVKCHPPGNRDPEKDEIEPCIPFLREQLRIIGPEVICCLGRVAGQALLGADFKISAQRGQWRSYQGIPLMPTFHPAYLLRNPSSKREVWEDIKKIMTRIGLEVRTHG